MPMPRGLGVIDLMMAIPPEPGDLEINPMVAAATARHTASGAPHGHLFKSLPDAIFDDDPAKAMLVEMDRFNVERAMIRVSKRNLRAQQALTEHPDRFLASYEVNPHLGMDGVRSLRAAFNQWGVKCATASPAAYQVPIDDRRWYPFYAACIDLDIPMRIVTGVPGPLVPLAPQRLELIDEVCWFFPELTLIICHGGEPWTELAVKLLLKWPNLYYSTSAMAPKHYPEPIIRFANTRGADKVLYAGYFPMGLTLERIFAELADLPLRDHVWPKFLRENAMRVLKIS